ncbi:MAG: hypothetical protein WBD07_18025 [Vicinamibacterales bacterium]
MTNERGDTQMSDAFARLRDGIEVPPIDPKREQALLAAFDIRWAQPRPRRGRWVRLAAAAALVATTLVLDRLIVTRAPQVGPAMSDPPTDMAGFVPWPGAYALPPFESGELMRVDLPVSALPTLGLLPPSSAAGVVQADIVVGQDGFARAVRLVQ